VIIIGLLGAIFMGIAANGPAWRGFSVNYVNIAFVDDDANVGGDDDKYLANDKCFYYDGQILTAGDNSFKSPFPIYNFFPAKQFSISLSNGLCFLNVPNSDTVIGPANPTGFQMTYGDVIPSSSFTTYGDYSCWGWNAKIDNIGDDDYYQGNGTAATVSPQIFADDGFLNSVCEYMQGVAENLAAKTIGSLKCSNWNRYAKRYQSAAAAAKAGIFFGVCGIVLGLAGAIMASKATETVKLIIQGLSGASMLLLMIMCFIVLGNGGDGVGDNPYAYFNNAVAFGCQPGWLNSQYTSFSTAGPGYVLTIICLIMSASQGGICLTTNVCYNPCCCPCCFAAVIPQQMQTGTADGTQMQNNNNNGVVSVNVGVKV